MLTTFYFYLYSSSDKHGISTFGPGNLMMRLSSYFNIFKKFTSNRLLGMLVDIGEMKSIYITKNISNLTLTIKSPCLTKSCDLHYQPCSFLDKSSRHSNLPSASSHFPLRFIPSLPTSTLRSLCIQDLASFHSSSISLSSQSLSLWWQIAMQFPKHCYFHCLLRKISEAHG